jgi:hypothetical protein
MFRSSEGGFESMSARVKRLVAVAAVVVATACGLAVPAAAQAAPVAAGSSQALACTKWQYIITEFSTIRDVPGGNVRDSARPPDFVNVDFSDGGAWYHGHFYHESSNGPVYFTVGWILAYHLAYVTCW